MARVSCGDFYEVEAPTDAAAEPLRTWIPIYIIKTRSVFCLFTSLFTLHYACRKARAPAILLLPQLGKQSVWHDWNHILHGTLSVDIYACPQCGKIEFFMPEAVTSAIHNAEKPAEGMHIAAYRCGSCGKCVPGEFKICPACGEEDAVLLPQVKCPVCGTLHDFDDPKCPSCGNR